MIALVTCALLLTGECGGAGRRSREAPSPADVEKELSRVVAEAAKTLPRVIDADTEMTSISAEGMTLVYGYQLKHLAGSDIEPSAKAQLVVDLKKNGCSNPMMRDAFLKRGVVVRHVYRDRDNAVVATAEVAWKDCEQR